MAQGQRLHGAGDGDIEKAALFVQRALHFRAGMGQQAVLQSDNMDVRKFQPLATVNGDERHGVTGGFLLFLALGIQHQIIEEILQTAPAGWAGWHSGWPKAL